MFYALNSKHDTLHKKETVYKRASNIMQKCVKIIQPFCITDVINVRIVGTTFIDTPPPPKVEGDFTKTSVMSLL